MSKISKITERRPKETTLPDGVYFGIWGGSIITIEYEKTTYECHTEEGVRGIGFKVMVEIKDGVATFKEVNN